MNTVTEGKSIRGSQYRTCSASYSSLVHISVVCAWFWCRKPRWAQVYEYSQTGGRATRYYGNDDREIATHHDAQPSRRRNDGERGESRLCSRRTRPVVVSSDQQVGNGGLAVSASRRGEAERAKPREAHPHPPATRPPPLFLPGTSTPQQKIVYKPCAALRCSAKVASLMCWNAFRLKRRSALLTTGVSCDQRPIGRVRDQRPGCDVPLVLATASIAIPGRHVQASSRPQ